MKSFLKIGKVDIFLISIRSSIPPLKYFSSVNIDKQETPQSSYIRAILDKLVSSCTKFPKEGLARFNSPIIDVRDVSFFNFLEKLKSCEGRFFILFRISL